MQTDPTKIAIVQQMTGCTASKARLVIRRLSECENGQPAASYKNRFDTTTQAAAVWCGVCKHTFLKYATDYPSELPYLKMGTRFMFRRGDVQAFINRRIQDGKSFL